MSAIDSKPKCHRIKDGSTKKVRITVTEECYSRLFFIANYRNEFPSMSDFVTAAIRYVVDVLNMESYLATGFNTKEQMLELAYVNGLTSTTMLFSQIYHGKRLLTKPELSCITVGDIPLQTTVSEGLLASASKISLQLNDNKIRPMTYFTRAAIDLYTSVLINRYCRTNDDSSLIEVDVEKMINDLMNRVNKE